MHTQGRQTTCICITHLHQKFGNRLAFYEMRCIKLQTAGRRSQFPFRGPWQISLECCGNLHCTEVLIVGCVPIGRPMYTELRYTKQLIVLGSPEKRSRSHWNRQKWSKMDRSSYGDHQDVSNSPDEILEKVWKCRFWTWKVDKFSEIEKNATSVHACALHSLTW